MYEAKEGGRDRRVESVGRTGQRAVVGRAPGVVTSRSRCAARGPLRPASAADRSPGLRPRRTRRAADPHAQRPHRADPPGSFLPAAERFRQIGAIDHWVIGRAIEMLHQTEAPRILHVNLSGMTISDPELVTALPARIARESGDPSRLAFEITETAAIENIDTATATGATALHARLRDRPRRLRLGLRVLLLPQAPTLRRDQDRRRVHQTAHHQQSRPGDGPIHRRARPRTREGDHRRMRRRRTQPSNSCASSGSTTPKDSTSAAPRTSSRQAESRVEDDCLILRAASAQIGPGILRRVRASLTLALCW